MAGATEPSGTPALCDPAELSGASGWRCSEHSDRLAELYCRRCRRCVCTLCPVLGAHRGHRVGLAQDEAAHVQNLTQEYLRQLATKKLQQDGNITQIEEAIDKLEAHAESSKTWLTSKFTELRQLLDEEEVLAKEFIHKNTELALQEYRDRIVSCGKQIDAINGLSSRVWCISQEPDPILLLQKYTATERELQQQMSLGQLCYPEPISFEPVKCFFKGLVETMQSMLQTPLEVRLKENLNCQLLGSSSAKTGSLLKTSPPPERQLFLKSDRLSVRLGLLSFLGPQAALRFNKLWQVLGSDCFAAGRHYWEVDLQEAGIGWWVGVAYTSLRRHGDAAPARLGCNRQSWCVKRYDLEYWAFHDGQRSRLQPHQDPDRLGVFLDYEAGILSFYDVTGSMNHLHTFRASFQEPLHPALRLWEGTISITRLP
ncbi:PREDICTED: tripartite motif-containing protein 14 [Condylura cristata]|uniref:tripartite motif-containing protein 14 n=1 Tax=Condylura cristata TaxID=143302 RepID=UPI0003346238|nr:PREDICTED: tripartite motif-containing protein 14 [Condylura cristata]